MSLFQSTVVAKYFKTQNSSKLNEKWDLFKSHFLNPTIQENIRNSKEEQYQEGFLRDLFVKILGYTLNPENNFNLTTELKNVKDGKKADGGIIINENVVGVVELKGTNTTDLGKVEEQAFGYKNNQPECIYVITSNFEKLRLYIDNAIEHIEFNLFSLSEQDFQLLYLCLAFENVKNNIPKKLKEESLSQEELITKQLYKDYSLFKRELFQNLCELNPQFEPLELFKKSQKLLDRCLFLFFAEDRNLLPPNSVRLILDQWKKLQELDAYTPLYDRFKKYFGYLNTGFKGKQYDVFPYNGGLFKPDEVLDNITINDDLLSKHSFKLSEYDFESEVDVNILGHIFENSLNELDEITAQLEGQVIDKSNTKRKKDGVFYTPKYITKYIVENTIGKLCEQKKAELDITDEAYQPAKQRSRKRLDNLNLYRNWLLQLTICDPACGSGAFLNQALDFLINEHRYIDELSAKYNKDAFILSDVEKSILENNLFGVDLNEESVEIAKLSLWLRTAQPNRKLNDLSDNIKCGNSLIDDISVAGEKAFHWQTEFPQIFAKGGFDVIIGNPPYALVKEDVQKDYFENNYKTTEGRFDLFELFLEKSLNLFKSEGLLSFILPNTLLSNLYTRKLRLFIVSKFNVEELSNFGMDVFSDPTVHTCIISISNKYTKNNSISIRKQVNNFEELDSEFDYTLKQEDVIKSNNNTFDIFFNPLEKKLIDKLESHESLGDICFIRQCIKTGNDPIYVTQSNETLQFPWKKSLRGKGIGRYAQFEDNLYLKYGDWLARNWKNKTFYETPKIVIRETGNRITSTLDIENHYLLSSLYSIYPKEVFSIEKLKGILAVLNSNVATYYIKKIAYELTKGAFTKVRTNQLSRLPVPKINSFDEVKLCEYVDNILFLNQQLHEYVKKLHRNLQREFEQLDKLGNKLENWYELNYAEFLKELKKKKIELSLSQKAEWEDYFLAEQQKVVEIQNQITSTDKEIDAMVYELYGLSEEEIAIVENN
jgi:type I restriction-modification system DNA methylase subunit